MKIVICIFLGLFILFGSALGLSSIRGTNDAYLDTQVSAYSLIGTIVSFVGFACTLAYHLIP